MTEEEDVYIWTKSLLRRAGWATLGGDPPKGTDLIRIEIQEPDVVHSLKKNKNSVIPDLVACKAGFLALVECKPRFEVSDVDKLRAVVEGTSWRKSLYETLEFKGVFAHYRDELHKEGVLSGEGLVPVVAYKGSLQDPISDFVQIGFTSSGNPDLRVGHRIPPKAQSLFS